MSVSKQTQKYAIKSQLPHSREVTVLVIIVSRKQQKECVCQQMLQTIFSDARTHQGEAPNILQPPLTSFSGPDAGGSDRPLSAGFYSLSRDCFGNELSQHPKPTASPSPLAPPHSESGWAEQSGPETKAKTYKDKGTRSPSAKHCL